MTQTLSGRLAGVVIVTTVSLATTADAHTERGFVLKVLGKHREALEAYRKALAEQHASSRHARPVTLRGTS